MLNLLKQARKGTLVGEKVGNFKPTAQQKVIKKRTQDLKQMALIASG